MKLLNFLKLSDEEITKLAIDEVRNYKNYTPINYGFFINLFFLVLIALFTLPILLYKILYIKVIQK